MKKTSRIQNLATVIMVIQDLLCYIKTTTAHMENWIEHEFGSSTVSIAHFKNNERHPRFTDYQFAVSMTERILSKKVHVL